MTATRVTLALQGGGSHGAYTWGVLERLLEEDHIEIEGISGASAGAMNAVMLAHGYLEGGRNGAREALRAFWSAVSDAPAVGTYVTLSRYFSPAQLNPLNLDPLRDLLAREIDFERLRRKSKLKLFIAATRVRDAALRIFDTREITVEVMLASACLPSLRPAVEIGGEAYWDGALVANPPLSVLVHHCTASSMLVVTVDPSRSDVPATPRGIRERLAEISFGSALATELHALELAKAGAERTSIPLGRLERRLRRLNVHVIGSAEYMAELDVASRFNTESAFIAELHDEGRRRADAWLKMGLLTHGRRGQWQGDSSSQRSLLRFSY